MKYFITDGTLPCLYTAIFYAITEKECVITSNANLQLTLDSLVVHVTEEADKAERVYKKITKLDSYATNDIELVWRAQCAQKEQLIFEYVKLLVRANASVRDCLADKQVFDFLAVRNKVTGELHNMKGFLRFIEMESGAFYAPYSPDHDITDLLVPHFMTRFKQQKFVIHDVKRKKAAIYNGKDWILCHTEGAEIYLSEYEKAFEDLWKKYYNAVNISARPHEKQMKGYMPMRYWDFMPEKQNNNPQNQNNE
jgi:probable DNA metabolism protein